MKSKTKTSESQNLTRNNHYVPQWYQKGFVEDGQQLHYLDLAPEEKILECGRKKKLNERRKMPFSKCFCEFDLYTTYLGNALSDKIEKEFFGQIDNSGAKAIKAFINEDFIQQHERFKDFFYYIDAQKIRTPKGLSWLREHYGDINQDALMMEMRVLQNMHCTMWIEGTREIVSAKDSEIKFIISDHPVTVYNYACPPSSKHCEYPYDPAISLNASQTLFPLNQDYCLILTNYEYASNPDSIDPIGQRTNARNFGETLARTDAWYRERKLSDKDVQKINFVIKKRSRRFIAAAKEEWLYPEKDQNIIWKDVKETLLPPRNKLYMFGGDMVAGFESGETYFQDAFGRTDQGGMDLKKEMPNREPSPNEYCPCGQGRKYKKCCRRKDTTKRPTWDEYSIRERNLIFYHGTRDILGLSKDKGWDDVRKEINEDQVKAIYMLYRDLWPVHTDLIKLLPKADGACRVVYVGVVDPRTISNYATSLTLYFDEVIIQNPFNHPNGFNSDYNPIEKPSFFKSEVLKNFLILEELYPFILSGIINFIPDITVFNRQLRTQVLTFGNQRESHEAQFAERDRDFFRKLSDDDFQRMICGMPEDFQRGKLREMFTDESDDFIDKVFEYSQKMRREDPMALLQDNIYQNGGQMTFSNLIPGPELAVFIAQITGAIIFTDSPTRFSQIVGKRGGNESFVQTHESVKSLEELDYPINTDSHTIFCLRENGYGGKVQRVWKDILDFLSSSGSESSDAFKHLNRKLSIEIQSLSHVLSDNSTVPHKHYTKYSFNAKFQFELSYRGVSKKDVTRLFLILGIDTPERKPPIIILGEPVD